MLRQQRPGRRHARALGRSALTEHDEPLISQQPYVDFAVLADAATAVEGKVYVHGGGWDRITATSFPFTHGSMALAVRILVPWGRANEKFNAELDLVDADGSSLFERWGIPKPGQTFEIGRPAGTEPGTELGHVFTWTFQGLVFERPGAYSFQVLIGDRNAKSLRFWVAQQG